MIVNCGMMMSLWTPDTGPCLWQESASGQLVVQRHNELFTVTATLFKQIYEGKANTENIISFNGNHSGVWEKGFRMKTRNKVYYCTTELSVRVPQSHFL